MTRLATPAQNAAAKAIGDLVDADAGAGTLKIYTGTQPATANDTPAGTLLATVAFSVTAFGTPANGVISATNPAAVTGLADGTPGCYLVEDASGDNVFSGTAGVTGSGAELVLQSAIVTGVSVDIESFTYTQPAGA